jgi:hypothetical protein
VKSCGPDVKHFGPIGWFRRAATPGHKGRHDAPAHLTPAGQTAGVCGPRGVTRCEPLPRCPYYP